MAMMPEVASVRQPDNSWRDVPAVQVVVGAMIRVRPGERFALDGVIAQGQSSVNQAPITGESIPVEKTIGDAVYAGSINEAGVLVIEVTAASTDSTVARIIHAVEAAQGSRAPTQRFIDQFARIYTPVVFALALLVAVLPPLLFDGLWLSWIYRALVLLVIACPCALVISTPVTIVSGLAAAARRGVSAEVDGQLLYLGNHRLVEDLKICSPQLEAQLTAFEMQGKTTTLLMTPERVLGVFAVADTVRDVSREAVAALNELGVHTTMLTGDNPLTAQAIAAEVGIENVLSELLPADKLTAIEALAKQYGVVGMVGDGINDAPALARADIGFAMGAAGSDTALETADVALMDDDPRKLAEFIQLSRRTTTILRQNIALALGIKLVFLALAILGNATLWMAVFADMGASLLVVANGLRLLKKNGGQS